MSTRKWNYPKVTVEMSNKQKRDECDDDPGDDPPYNARLRSGGGMNAMEVASQLSGKELVDPGWTPPEYPIDDIGPDAVNSLDDIVLVVGKRRTGKSWFVRDYLYARRKL